MANQAHKDSEQRPTGCESAQAHGRVSGYTNHDQAAGGGDPVNLRDRFPEIAIVFEHGIAENRAESTSRKLAQVVGIGRYDLIALVYSRPFKIHANPLITVSQTGHVQEAIRTGPRAHFQHISFNEGATTNLLECTVDGWVHLRTLA